MREHIAAERGIERSGNRDVIVVRHDGFNVAVARGLCPGASGLNRTRLAVDSDDKTRRPDGFRKQHRYIACSTADIQNPHARLDIAFTDQSAGDIGEGGGLDLKALDLEIGMAENVVCCTAHGLSLNWDEVRLPTATAGWRARQLPTLGWSTAPECREITS
jgi:hypothetical protein